MVFRSRFQCRKKLLKNILKIVLLVIFRENRTSSCHIPLLVKLHLQRKFSNGFQTCEQTYHDILDILYLSRARKGSCLCGTSVTLLTTSIIISSVRLHSSAPRTVFSTFCSGVYGVNCSHHCKEKAYYVKVLSSSVLWPCKTHVFQQFSK